LGSTSGLPIKNNKEFIKASDKFLKNNVNPFCIGINQVFHLLKKDNFECTIGCNDLNFIKITEKISVKNIQREKNNNIIQFKI